MASSAQIAKSGLWLTGGFAVIRGLQLITQIILARLLTKEELGIWGMVLIITTLSGLFKDTALASVLVQRGLDDKKLVNAVYSLTLNISIALFVIQTLAGYPLSLIFNQPIVWPLTACVALVFLIGAGNGSHNAVLSRQMKFREIAIADISAAVVWATTLVVGSLLGWGVWCFAIAEVLMIAVVSVLKHRLSGYRFTYYPIPDPVAIKAVRGYMSSLVGINLAVYVNTNSDNFVIGKLLGAGSLGVYNLAYQLAMLPSFALSQINNVNFSVLSQLDREGKQAYVGRTLELYALSYAPLYGLGCVVAPWLIPWVYGSSWAEAVPLFQIILIFAYARGFMSILGTTLNALDKPNWNAAINWALVPLTIPTFIFGARWGNSLGVAIGVALVLGIGATCWFWVAACRAAQWPMGALLNRIWVPTLTVPCWVMLARSFLPLYLQPLLVGGGYIATLSLLAPTQLSFILDKLSLVFSKLAKRTTPAKVGRPW
jgi:O-antigen/teichoic acid export membrane protein